MIWFYIRNSSIRKLKALKFNGTDWTHYLPSNSPLHSANLTKLKVDKQGNLWIGSAYMGVFRLNKFGTGN